MKKLPILTLISYVLCLGTVFGQTFSNPLFIPDTLTGPVYNLNMAPSSKQFLNGAPSNTYGINSDYLGPTLIMRKGDQVQMNVTNSLTDTSTMHWHGMHVAPEDDGGPHTMIFPGTTWSPEFTVMDEATTFWYHPHLHHKTAEQVYAGAAGMILIRDDHSDSLNLPHTYGVDEFPLIIQDKTFDSTNQFIFAAMADTIMINGTLSPFLEVPAQWVRFHILNASNQRVYNFGFAPGTGWVIGGDGGLLEQPVPLTRLLMAPGERAEIVVNFAGMVGQSVPFSAFNSEMDNGVSGAPMGPGGGPGNPLDGADFDLLQIRVTPPTPNAVTSIPNTLNSYTVWNPADVDRERVKVFDTLPGNPFLYLINSTPFNMMEVNDTVMLDDIEIWTLINATDVAHPFHIHDIQFFILDINGNLPPAPLRGRKDVVLSSPGDTIRFITRFEDFADSTIPYMYHCHNLFHEDAGMMGQFVVFEEGWVSRNENIAEQLGVDIFPNPTSGAVRIRQKPGAMHSIQRVEIWGLDGRMQGMEVPDWPSEEIQTDLAALPGGMYLLRVVREDGATGTFRVLRN